MIHLAVELIGSLPADVTVPPIAPDFSAPFMVGVQTVVSYILGAALVIMFGVLIVAVASLGFKSIVPERMQSWAGENVATVAIATIILGSISGIFAWLVNFNFGF
ncbi:hypothetical protein [Salinibacterium sp. TMP30]|uniref:hypothetical protein n=1 Tax=Salinibacterium sp. TMP30 TaxID=3138237 RepID=UPI003139CEBA